MAEASLATQVDRYLKSLGKDCWFFNVQGSGVQRAGIPDRIVCYKGIFIGLELKRPDGKGVVSPRQRIEIAKIEEAGGFCGLIEKVSEVEDLIWYLEHIVINPYDYSEDVR